MDFRPEQDIVWHPDLDQLANTEICLFMKHCGVADYDTLLESSDADPAWFWGQVIDYMGIQFYQEFLSGLGQKRN